jgi:hypothetical protein
MGKLNESLFLLKENLKEEKDQRNLKINELEKNINYELASQRKFNDGSFLFTKNSTTKLLTTSSRV